MSCKYDREAEDYIGEDGQPCRIDDHGDPTKHCTNRRSCGEHIGYDELTCSRCITRTRNDARAIPGLTLLADVQAVGPRVESEALYLAGPAADPEAWSWRKLAARTGSVWHVSLEEDDDERHPYAVLTRWEFMLREDYGQERRDATTVQEAADYIDRMLHKVAQDPNQDFRDLSRDMKRVRRHLESVIRNRFGADRGAPCPECKEDKPRLVRVYGHWCTDEECTKQFHYADDSGDLWICPRNPDHRWEHEAYEKYLEDRRSA